MPQSGCKTRPLHFKRLVAKSMRIACRQVSNLAKVIMRAAEEEGSGQCGTEYDSDDDDDSHGKCKGEDDRCAKVMRAARFSPVAVEHAFGDEPDAQLLAAIPTCTHALLFVYCELVICNLWNTLFHSGKGGKGGKGDGGPAGGRSPVRALATRHLHHPSTDGWNVVAGASALAHQWALCRADLPRHALKGACALSESTRIRLAVCLNVAWKFERSCSTHFHRRFYSAEPNLFSPHTHELAFVGYSFLSPHQQRAFGPWNATSADKIRKLYKEMVSLEIDLLSSVNVMALLTRNVQVLSEDRITELLDTNVVDADAAMAMRSVVPFFIIASQDGKRAPPSAGALVCATMLCMSVPTTVRAPVLHCHKTVCERFTENERRGAFELLDQATHLQGLAVTTIASSCYVDEDWVHYPFVCADALRVALFMAHDACKQE